MPSTHKKPAAKTEFDSDTDSEMDAAYVEIDPEGLKAIVKTAQADIVRDESVAAAPRHWFPLVYFLPS
jgi:hypothetical protein